MTTYPLYQGEEQTATIDDNGAIRDLRGRFLAAPEDRDELLAACRIVASHESGLKGETDGS